MLFGCGFDFHGGKSARILLFNFFLGLDMDFHMNQTVYKKLGSCADPILLCK